MKKLLSALAAGGAGLILAAGPAAAQAPPPPTAANGATVSTVGHVVGTPTAIAQDPATGTLFVATGPDESAPPAENAPPKGGGIYAIAPGGAPTLVPGVNGFVFGLAFQDGVLYASTLNPQTNAGAILALSQWNGTAFGSSKTIFNPAKTVGAANGLAIGPDGRLYSGAALNIDVNKKGKLTKKIPYPNPFTVFSIKTDGSGFKVLSRGLRQPWQLTFPQGSSSPYVTVLSQEVGKIPPDAIVVAKQGTNFGFPGCFLKTGIACKGKTFGKPLVRFPQHGSPMGIGSLGDTLYVALFGKMEVDTVPVAGGKPTPFLTKFAAPVVLTNVIDGTLYAGDLTGFVYKVSLT